MVNDDNDDRSWLEAMLLAGAEMYVKANHAKYGPPPYDLACIYQEITGR